MTKKLSLWDTISLGLMVLCFFLGAGNLIFPPLAGQYAGDNLALSVFGFLLTAVGLPLLALLALAKVGGGIQGLGRHLPEWVSRAFSIAVYFILVPGFGIPRTCLVAYELGFAPFFDEPSQLILLAYSVFYFALAMWFVLNPGKLIDSVGKVLMPVLGLCVVFLGIAVALDPFAAIAPASNGYDSMPFGKGFIEGYNTMDALAALIFGILMVESLRAKGIECNKEQFAYMARASVVAALGLTIFYIALFYLGATSTGVIENPDNGGAVLVAYINVLFGDAGQYLLTIIVTIACFSTAVGGISSFSAYMSSISKASYKMVALASALACVAVANMGLSLLLKVSIPVLVGIYPMAILLIVFNLMSNRFKRPRLTAMQLMVIAGIFGLLDMVLQFMRMNGFGETANAAMGVLTELNAFLPGIANGFGWVLPSAIVIAYNLFGREERNMEGEAA